jgi:hypothetical protein
VHEILISCPCEAEPRSNLEGQTVTATASPAELAPPSLIISLYGRIEEVREIKSGEETFYQHKIRVPSEDRMSQPPLIAVRHTARLGKDKAVVPFKVRLGGYPERWNSKDANGNSIRRERMVNTLDVVTD